MLLQLGVIRRPINQTERQFALPAGEFELPHLVPIAVAVDKMAPVDVEPEEIKAAHAERIEPCLQGVNEGK